MDAAAFWNVIGIYNANTKWVQLALLVVLIAGIVASYATKCKWAAKAVLGALNLFIGIGFFAAYGTEAIQKYFALPLYLASGVLFLFEAVRNREDAPAKPFGMPLVLLALYAVYPLVSLLFGASFPKMVTHIMPCPVVTVSIAVTALYPKKNFWLTALLTVWGLTGVKALIFAAYEDCILLLAGLYGVWLLVKMIKQRRAAH